MIIMKLYHFGDEVGLISINGIGGANGDRKEPKKSEEAEISTLINGSNHKQVMSFIYPCT